MARAIDWGSAEVHDGELTVRLSEDAPKRWRDRFEAVLARLGGGEGVKAGKAKLTVAGVAPGREEDVRHLLDSAVLQANADLGEGDAEASSEPDEADERDRSMTRAFRAFADG